MSECCFQMFLEICEQRHFYQIYLPCFVFKCFQQFVKKFRAEEKVGCKLELSAGLRMDKVDLCFPLFVSRGKTGHHHPHPTCKAEFVFVCLFVLTSRYCKIT